ncbi:MAG TPA: sulfotransferase [Gemmatimonadales bacterium]|nr:sulfotransferase [Gemmatimonadales bacterium]
MSADQRPLFIFGCPRSGTSLLTRMLNAHPNIAIPYESHLYNRVYPIVGSGESLADPRRRRRLVAEILHTDYVRHWEPAPDLSDTMASIVRYDFHGVVDGLLRAWTARQGKVRWGEKTPQHTLWWQAISEGFPDLQVIHLVRDGRDVALSYRDAHFGPKHVYQLARRWEQYLGAAEDAAAALGARAFLTVRYEDLLAEPERELRRTSEFLGERFDPAMMAYHEGEAAAYPTDPRNEGNLRRPILRQNSQKWRTRMSARDLRIFEALAGEALDRYGYDRGVRQPRISPWERMSSRLLEDPPRRAMAMLTNRQGHRLALETVRLYIQLRLRPW